MKGVGAEMRFRFRYIPILIWGSVSGQGNVTLLSTDVIFSYEIFYVNKIIR